MLISIVVAVSKNNAIGAKGDLLWRLPADMKRFKEITYGHHVLMGRKTYESIPEKYRPLPGRVNIVVSKNQSFYAEGCKVVQSVDEGIQFAKDHGEEELMVIGGGEIYRQVFSVCNKIYLTVVNHSFVDADTFFPDIKKEEWISLRDVSFPPDEKHSYGFSFIELERAKSF